MKEYGRYLSAVKGDKLGVDKTKSHCGGRRKKYKREMLESERKKLHEQNKLSSMKKGNGSGFRLEA